MQLPFRQSGFHKRSQPPRGTSPQEIKSLLVAFTANISLVPERWFPRGQQSIRFLLRISDHDFSRALLNARPNQLFRGSTRADSSSARAHPKASSLSSRSPRSELGLIASTAALIRAKRSVRAQPFPGGALADYGRSQQSFSTASVFLRPRYMFVNGNVLSCLQSPGHVFSSGKIPLVIRLSENLEPVPILLEEAK